MRGPEIVLLAILIVLIVLAFRLVRWIIYAKSKALISLDRYHFYSKSKLDTLKSLM